MAAEAEAVSAGSENTAALLLWCQPWCVKTGCELGCPRLPVPKQGAPGQFALLLLALLSALSGAKKGWEGWPTAGAAGLAAGKVLGVHAAEGHAPSSINMLSRSSSTFMRARIRGRDVRCSPFS